MIRVATVDTGQHIAISWLDDRARLTLQITLTRAEATALATGLARAVGHAAPSARHPAATPRRTDGKTRPDGHPATTVTSHGQGDAKAQGRSHGGR